MPVCSSDRPGQVDAPRVARLVLVLALTLVGGALLTGCGSEGPDTPPRVLLIGLDGAEWDLLRPMMEAGEMPNLKGLVDSGVSGNLQSLGPPLAKSPAIWTTIATGKRPQDHGITGFVSREKGPGGQYQPLTENARKVNAIWNILSAVGKTVGVVGWLVTWPAEEVNGFIVTDYLQYSASKRDDKMTGRTHPPDLATRIAPQVTPWEEVPWSFAQTFLDAPLDTTRLGKFMGLFNPIRTYVAADQTFARVGLMLYEEQRPDLMAVYLRGMDTMGHLYWNYMTPDAVPAGSLDADAAPYLAGAVRAYYRYVDSLLGPLIDAADEHTAIVVVSDHGFQGGPGRGVEVHKIDGVIIMSGYGIGKGAISGAKVFDITPTLLTLLGLPAAQDMPGKVLWSALDETVVPRDRFTQQIPTYETGDRQGSSPTESAVDDELIERLKALGYID